MSLVSVIIPAYKAEYLESAIQSALLQTHSELEVLVGDDTSDGRLEQIVNRFTDKRVKYFHHGFGDAELNLRRLWGRARGHYIKPLFDDDILLPESVALLLAALMQYPESALAFHERVFIDSTGKIIGVPPSLLDAGTVAPFDRNALVQAMVANVHNLVGEPSSTMMRRKLVDVNTAYIYSGFKLDFLSDVASYLNLATDAPIIAVGGYLSAFRKHENQASNRNSPRASAGLYEWELIVRSEAASGTLSGEALQTARRTLRNIYSPHVREMPEIARLSSRLDDLATLEPTGLASSESFQVDLATARSAVAARLSMAQRSTPTANYCSVCEQPVGAWLAHPNLKTANFTFLDHMSVIGSRLDMHSCPSCGCNDRDRHLWLNIAAAGLMAKVSDMRILHIAPEAKLEPKITALGPLEYVAGDLFPRAAHHRRIDVEALDFADGYFDLIICNHVLEHVSYPNQALSEFSRCLAPGGYVVAQTPYSSILKQTIETSIALPTEFCTYYYGQDDHVRLFGLDLVTSFHANGLNGDLIPHTTLLGDIDPDAYGVNPVEPFFLFQKDDVPSDSERVGEVNR